MDIEFDASELYKQMGRVIAEWTNIESTLLKVLESSFTINSKGLAPREVSLMYWSVISFEARLKMVSSVVQHNVIYYDDLWKEWNSLHNHLTKKARKRAEVAHGSVSLLHGFLKDGILLIPNGGRQNSSFDDLAKHNEIQDNMGVGYSGAITASNLSDRADGMIKTNERLIKFSKDRLAANQASGYPEITPSPAALQRIRDNLPLEVSQLKD